ncbi:hypothetical protein E0W45_04895 [Neisseria meningitidis]|nr:hypothetical protein A6J49_13825 [Neisseria meningitidis]MBG8624108.1 hypothetical protein [Neisseria meningitidis]MBG8635097.1 hypothetical protein [Neisseria meningitidis]MBG8645036.1 hypothetical protein [Neisseria meningitidis]MBG8679737.1 hypothetical protein [Neisseria meningitidis]
MDEQGKGGFGCAGQEGGGSECGKGEGGVGVGGYHCKQSQTGNNRRRIVRYSGLTKTSTALPRLSSKRTIL